MKQDEYKKHILGLITRLQNGHASDAEKAEIDAWYESMASEEKYAEGMSDAEKLQAKEKMFGQINSRIQTTIAPVKTIKPFPVKRMAWAAIILLMLGSSVYYFLQQREQPIYSDIKAGGNKAILTLADGKKISLTDATDGEVAKEAGVTISKTADGQLLYETNGGSQGSAIGYNTLEVPAGGQWQAILPDGSHVWINALSSIKFPTSFAGAERKIELKGEAYFEVAHNKAMPFKVESKGQTVEVLGTHFNVMAYDDESLIKTTLLEGAVKVSYQGNAMLLKPGEQAQASSSNIHVSNDVDLEDVMAWKSGYFKINENIEGIMSKIARWYNVEIVYESRPDPTILYGGEISRNKDLAEVLNIVQHYGNVHFKVTGRRVTVMK